MCSSFSIECVRYICYQKHVTCQDQNTYIEHKTQTPEPTAAQSEASRENIFYSTKERENIFYSTKENTFYTSRPQHLSPQPHRVKTLNPKP